MIMDNENFQESSELESSSEMNGARVSEKDTTLSDVCEFIVDCLHKTAPTQKVGYPSIRTPNVERGRLLLDGVNRVSEVYTEWTKRAMRHPLFRWMSHGMRDRTRLP